MVPLAGLKAEASRAHRDAPNSLIPAIPYRFPLRQAAKKQHPASDRHEGRQENKETEKTQI